MSKLSQLKHIKIETWAKLYGTSLFGGGIVGSVSAIYNDRPTYTNIPNKDDFMTGVGGFIHGTFQVLWAPVIVPSYMMAKVYKNKEKELKLKQLQLKENEEFDKELINFAKQRDKQ
jgi:hypothetical protein